MAEVHDRLDRVKELSNIRLAMRELYFRYDDLSDDEAEERLDSIQRSIQSVRAQVQKRRSERVPPTPPTPQG